MIFPSSILEVCTAFSQYPFIALCTVSGPYYLLCKSWPSLFLLYNLLFSLYSYEIISNTSNSLLFFHLTIRSWIIQIGLFDGFIHSDSSCFLCYILIALQFTFSLHISRNHNLYFCDLIKLAVFYL